MSIARRSVLKGIALGSAALALSATGLLHAAYAGQVKTTKPLLVLVSDDATHSAFIAGVKANPDGVQAILSNANHELAFISAFQQRLKGSKGERIIGLVDDASGMLLIALARSAAAQVHWIGQHVTQNGVSRHRLSATDSSVRCIQQFAEFADDCSRPTALIERTLSTNNQWASSLGFALASPGLNRRYSGTTPPTHIRALDGHYVSFSIET